MEPLSELQLAALRSILGPIERCGVPNGWCTPKTPYCFHIHPSEGANGDATTATDHVSDGDSLVGFRWHTDFNSILKAAEDYMKWSRGR